MFTALRADLGEEALVFTFPRRSNVLRGALQARSERDLISKKGQRAEFGILKRWLGGSFTCCTERGSCMMVPNLPPIVKE